MKNPSLNIRITFPNEFKSTHKVKVYIDTEDTSSGSFDIDLSDTSLKSTDELWAEIRRLAADDFLKECWDLASK